ncbi:hypothetical protein KR074_004321 [Drosophila pseudoananassae]|nr:hypothetical protein KR074_004321 [Drosophila pseudoananassae]
MKRKIHLIFLMVSCISFATCNAEENEEFETIKNLTQSLAKLVRKYNSEFESNGNLDELEAVISTIDNSMLDYQGLAKNQLDSLRTSYSAAHITYRATVDPVFEWCVAINSTLDLFISQIDNINLSQSDRGSIWKIMAKGVLVSGINKAGSSLKELNQLQSKTKTLNEILSKMLQNIEADFRPNGYYEKRRQEIIDKTTPKPWDTGSKIVDVISRFFNAIIAFLKDPHKGVAPFKEEFCRKGLDDVMDERRPPTYQEELAAIQLFFKVLGDEIKNAVLISDKVSGDFEKDKSNLEQLSQINKENILNWLESNPELRGQLIPSFQELGKVCADYQILRSNPGPRRPQPTPTQPPRDSRI